MILINLHQGQDRMLWRVLREECQEVTVPGRKGLGWDTEGK